MEIPGCWPRDAFWKQLNLLSENSLRQRAPDR